MRQRLSLDRNWRFALGHAADAARDFQFARDRSLVKAGEARGAAGLKFDDSSWRVVNLPHDWAIELPLVQKDDREHVEHGSLAIGPDFPKHSVGWYRLTFTIPKSDLAADTTYTLVVGASARDRQGRPLAGPFTLRFSTAPVASMRRSARVDLPWSMWATMQKLRMRDWGVGRI